MAVFLLLLSLARLHSVDRIDCALAVAQVQKTKTTPEEDSFPYHAMVC